MFYQLNVKTTLLYGDIEIPEIFKTSQNLVLKLRKSLYRHQDCLEYRNYWNFTWNLREYLRLSF